ncbi:MAG: glycosyltransferase family 2 protein [Candidatus Hydrogenedentota bacterium]
MKFGVIIPVYNEPRLAGLLARFDFAATPDVFVVDDGSDDGSTRLTGSYPVTLLKHERRIGVGAAIRTGLLHLKDSGFDVAVVMAGNNKDNPAEIPLLLDPLSSGADYVQGSRYMRTSERGAFGLGRHFLTRTAPILWSLRFGRRLTEVTSGFRAYRLSLLDRPGVDIRQDWLNKYELELYLQYKALALGLNYVEVPVTKVYPSDGRPTSKIRLLLDWDWWSFMRPIVLLSLGLKK